jgi:hypothetical protein
MPPFQGFNRNWIADPGLRPGLSHVTLSGRGNLAIPFFTMHEMPRRSPIIFGLLFAATLAVDAVAICWWASDIASTTSTTLFLALWMSQINLACVWAVLSKRQPWWLRGCGLFAFVFVAAAVPWAVLGMWFYYLPPWPSHALPNAEFFRTLIGLFAAQAAASLILIWILQQVLTMRSSADGAAAQSWQFSLLQILAVMTVAAVLLAVLRSADNIVSQWLLFATLLAESSAMVVIVVWSYQLRRIAWPIRLAGCIGTAILLGITAYGVLTKDGELYWIPMNLIHVGVLWIWLHLARLVPRASVAIAAPLPQLQTPE